MKKSGLDHWLVLGSESYINLFEILKPILRADNEREKLILVLNNIKK